jgi:hypothetical protein
LYKIPVRLYIYIYIYINSLEFYIYIYIYIYIPVFIVMLKCINTSQAVCLGRCIGLTTLPPSRADCLDILGASTSCPKGLSGL